MCRDKEGPVRRPMLVLKCSEPKLFILRMDEVLGRKILFILGN
jgi:hypothetical protein